MFSKSRLAPAYVFVRSNCAILLINAWHSAGPVMLVCARAESKMPFSVFCMQAYGASPLSDRGPYSFASPSFGGFALVVLCRKVYETIIDSFGEKGNRREVRFPPDQLFNGSIISTAVPTPGSLSMRRRPLCCSMMLRVTMIPRPLPFSLVV